MSIWSTFFILDAGRGNPGLGQPWVTDYNLETRGGTFHVSSTSFFRGLRFNMDDCETDAEAEVTLDERQVRALRDALTFWLDQ